MWRVEDNWFTCTERERSERKMDFTFREKVCVHMFTHGYVVDITEYVEEQQREGEWVVHENHRFHVLLQ